jgi:hypothetical protein
MNNNSIEDRERIAKQIAKTSDLIRKKYRALKTGKIEEDIALEKQFKPIVEPLKQIVENTEKSQPITKKVNIVEDTEDSQPIKKKVIVAVKRKIMKEANVAKDVKEEANVAKDIMEKANIAKKIIKRKHEYSGNSDRLFELTPPPRKQRKKQSNDDDDNTLDSSTFSFEPTFTSTPAKSHELSPFIQGKEEDVEMKDTNKPVFEKSLREALQLPKERDALHSQLGPLGRKYMDLLFGNDRQNEVDYVYGVYFGKDSTMLGDKRFDIDRDDSLIIDKVRYNGTPGLYELIFKRLPDEAIFTEDDKQMYTSILLATNAHRRSHSADNPIMGNKGYKYKHIIAPLVSKYNNKKGTGVIPSTMRLTDNKIDYVHWDDPNELVDRLRLLDASRRAGNNAHDNEILSIIEELCEVGLIIN